MNESMMGLLAEIVRTGPVFIVLGWIMVAITHFTGQPDIFTFFVAPLTVIYVILVVVFIVLIELDKADE